MSRHKIEVVENATNVANINPEQPYEQVVADCMKDYLEYRKLEEKGLLLKLPCKVGDKVFVLTGLEDDNIVHEGKCVGYTKNELRGWLIEVNYFGGYKSFESFTEIGKSVFLTKEEAEQKISELN